MKKANSILLTMALFVFSMMNTFLVNAQFHSETNVVEANSSALIEDLIEKDGSLYYINTTSQGIFENSESCVFKIDISSGDTLHELCIETSSFRNLEIDNDDNIVLSFRPEEDFDYDLSDDGEAFPTCSGSGCVALVKYDQNNDLVSHHFFKNQFGFSIADVVTDSDNNIYILGNERYVRADFDPSTETAQISGKGEHDIFFAKYGPDGSFKWIKTYGGALNEIAFEMLINDENEITLTGGYRSSHFAYASGDTLYNNNEDDTQNLFIIKADSSGDILSAQYFNAIGDPRVSDIHLEEDGTLTMVGYTDGFLFYIDPEDDSQTLISQNSDGYLVQLDENGALLNSFVVENFHYTSVDLDEKGNIYTTGSFGFDGDIDVDLSDDSEVNYTSAALADIVWAKYSPDYDYLNSGQIGGFGSDFPTSNGIIVLAEDDFFLGGKAGFTTLREVFIDFDPSPDSEFTIEITTINGASFLSRYTPDQPTGIEDELGYNFSVYPNPSSGNINVELGTENENIELRDLYGTLVKVIPLSSDETLTIEGLNEGIYFLSGINKNGEKTFTEKIIIQ